MTYFGFLLRFLLVPTGILVILLAIDAHRGRKVPAYYQNWAPWAAIALHVAIALLYTTPWDNYLVATRVWWYDPALVTGFTIGWVPIEEYTFFILQPILGGLWLLWLIRRIPVGAAPPSGTRIRAWAAGAFLGGWVLSLGILLSPWAPGTYLGLEFGWALPPIALQLAFGADILWRQRRTVLLTILPLTLYLSFADALAIGWGTWTIDPAQSTGILLGGVLPIEEFFFFLLTNTLVTFGVALVMSTESRARLRTLRSRVFQPRQKTSPPMFTN